MRNFMESGFLIGLGAGLLVKDSVEGSLEDLMSRGKREMAEAQGRKETFLKQIIEQFDDLNIRGKTEASSALKAAGLTPYEEFEALQRRVEALEKALAHATGQDAKKPWPDSAVQPPHDGENTPEGAA